MNTPNKITMFRIILVPFFVFFLLKREIPNHFLYALIIFLVASITDGIDGYIARKNNLVTHFGQFLDPLADKILVFSALICFIELQLASSISVVLIMSRDFIISAIRLVAIKQGKVISANLWGKIKTVLQMIVIMFILLLGHINDAFGYNVDFYNISNFLIWVLSIITILSAISYILENKKYILENK